MSSDLFTGLDRDNTLRAIECIASIGVIISSLEWLAQPAKVRDTGVFSWRIMQLRRGWMTAGPIASMLGVIFGYPGILVLFGLRLTGAISLLSLPHTAITMRTAIIIILAIIALLIRFRAPIGLDGSDQMSSILFTALSIGRLIPSPHAADLVLWFITLQACLAYVTAGWLKAKEKGWREGTYLARIFTTATYGVPRFGEYLKTHLGLASMMALFVIAVESLFPLVLVLPLQATLGVLTAAALFHVSSAAFMGLNTFVWSFLATYPAILYCRTMLV